MARELIVSIDAMGGDNAPQAIIDGVGHAHIRHPKVRFLLHGDHARLQPLLLSMPAIRGVVQVEHSDDTVAMDDKPSQALRRGRNTSMWRSIDSVRKKEAQVAVSAGNTGALMAMSIGQLRTVEGISRPAIAAPKAGDRRPPAEALRSRPISAAIWRSRGATLR